MREKCRAEHDGTLQNITVQKSTVQDSTQQFNTVKHGTELAVGY